MGGAAVRGVGRLERRHLRPVGERAAVDQSGDLVEERLLELAVDGRQVQERHAGTDTRALLDGGHDIEPTDGRPEAAWPKGEESKVALATRPIEHWPFGQLDGGRIGASLAVTLSPDHEPPWNQ
jgi:hypothetical protein